MRSFAALLLGALLLAQATAFAQERGRDRDRVDREDFRRQERMREDPRRERAERMERRGHRRFSHEEREKLRQDIIDANREMKRGR
jgi:hypothetical protein